MASPRVAVAVAVAVGSALPFQGGTERARAEVGSATGPLVVADGGAVLVAQGLQPGDTRVGEVTVRNAGDTSGVFALSQADRVDSADARRPAVGRARPHRHGRQRRPDRVRRQARRDADGRARRARAQGAAHRYRFTIAFPAGAAAFDNQFQVASTTVSFVWSAGPVAPAPPPAVAQPAPAPPVTLGTATRPTARLVAASRQRGRVVRLQLTCQAACRARFTATARGGGRSMRVRAVTRAVRKPGRITVRLTLPRGVRGGRTTTVRVIARVTIDGRSLWIRKTVRLAAKRHRARYER
jgi:spore coat-associated protein N